MTLLSLLPSPLRLTISSAASWLRRQRAAHRRRSALRGRTAEIAHYLAAHDCRKLHLGASNKPLASWLNTDIELHTPGVIYLDCTRAFPFEDGSFDFVFCEHFIEHLTRADGLACMKEAHRCLKPGGVFRLATPDLEKFVGLFAAPLGGEQQRYLEQYRRLFELPEAVTACVALNAVMRNWGHEFIYSQGELTDALGRCGFSDIRTCDVGASRHEALRNVERHQEFCGEEMNRFETMVLEATK